MTALLLAAMDSLYVVLASNTSCWTVSSVPQITQDTLTVTRSGTTLSATSQPSHLRSLPNHWLDPSDKTPRPLHSQIMAAPPQTLTQPPH